jgi:hypothetical protein
VPEYNVEDLLFAMTAHSIVSVLAIAALLAP